MSKIKLEIRNIFKLYVDSKGQEIKVLRKINFDVSDGEFLCIIGPSGCGKTTLLRIIAGLERINEGSVIMDGKLVDRPSPERSMIFQESTLFPWMTIRKNVEFGLDYKQIPKPERKVISTKYLDLVNLIEWGNRYPNELSGGMKQLAVIARALAVDSQILLMDEPLGSLDAQTRNQMQMELLKIWEKTAKTIIFITHNIDEAIFLADRIIVLTSRPSEIKNIHIMQLKRPRDRTGASFQQIRRKIFKELE